MTDTEALRRMVREVLREVLPAAGSSQHPEPAQIEPAQIDVRRVRVRDDHDLADLVTQVLNLAEDPGARADLRAGRTRFALAVDDSRAEPGRPEPLEVDHGAVTERLVQRAAREGRPLLAGQRAVVTPLARDRARVLGVNIERRDTR